MVARPRQPKDRKIVRFCSTAGKHNLGGAAAQQGGHGFASALDGGPRLLSMMVDGGRVAKVLAKVWPHGLQDLGEHRSSRVVVEIDPAHHAAFIVLMRREVDRVRDGPADRSPLTAGDGAGEAPVDGWSQLPAQASRQANIFSGPVESKPNILRVTAVTVLQVRRD